MEQYKIQLEHAVDRAIRDHFDRFDYCQHVKERKQEAETICLYGTGKYFRDYVQNIDRFDYVCDSDPGKWGQYFEGKKCLSPDQLEQIPSPVVFIMAGYYQEIQDYLNDRGIENYYFGDLFLNVYDTKYPPEWFEDNRQEILDTLCLFADEWSKKVYANVICNRIAPKFAELSFHEMEEKGEYFQTGLWSYDDRECFVDAGAYNGDSICSFLETVGGAFEAVYGLEPDPENFEQLLRRVELSEDSRIHLIRKGISDRQELVRIVQAGGGSHIGAEGESVAEMDCLDTILGDRKVTFLKMDVEGLEQQGLTGAERLLRTWTPKLAVSVYHRLEDLWKIPKMLKEINPSYQFYLRHHTAVAWDTDLYACEKQ